MALDRQGDGTQTYDWPLSKGDRHHLIAGLKKLDYGYAAELAERLEATKCSSCRGSGYASYVGGDDDDDGCERCGGDGFDNQHRPYLVRFDPDALKRLRGRAVVIVGFQPSEDGLYDLLLKDADV